MSIFNDKALKGVADAVSKIMDEELKGNQHKIDANKNGKVDAHDFKLLRAKKGMKEEAEKMAKKDHDQDGKIESGKAEYLGSRIRAAKMAGKLKEETQSEMLKESEQLQEYESKGGVFKHKAKLAMGSKYGESDYSKGGEEDTESKKDLDYQKTSKKTGARQNNFNRGKSTGYTSKAKTVKEETKLSFTEMLQLYNEAGLEVIAKIVPEKVNFGDIEVEVFDADKINGTIETDIVEEGVMSAVKGAVGVVKDVISKERAYQAQKQMSTGNTLKKLRKEESLSEEPDNETFTKEVEAQKEKNAGRGKKAEVAKASVQAVKQEDVEQIDEVSKKTLGSYIKAASHDVAAKGAFTRHFADKSRAETAAQRPDLARLTMKKADKMQDAGMKRRANMAKAVDRLTKEDVEQIDERTLTSGETAKKEDYVKGMKKSVSGFKARYGDDAKSVMYATATKMAKKD